MLMAEGRPLAGSVSLADLYRGKLPMLSGPDAKSRRHSRCAFCGGRPLTREHAIPRWCVPLLDEQVRVVATRDFARGTRTRDGWENNRLDVVVRAICHICNNGWMADLEKQAAPVLSRAIVSPPTNTMLMDVNLVATWITKTALTCSLLVRADPPSIPTWQYRWFYHHRHRFPDSSGWLGAYAFRGHSAFSISTVLLGPPGVGAFRTTLNIGAFVFVLAVVPGLGRSLGRVRAPRDVAPFLTKLYPRLRNRVAWPPRRIMTEHALHKLSSIDHSAWKTWSPNEATSGRELRDDEG